MHISRLLALPFIALAFLAVTFHSPIKSPRHITPHTSSQMTQVSEGKEGDPDARDRFEWMRLRDPKTGKIPDDIRAKELAFASTLPAWNESTEQSAFLKNLSGASNQGVTWQERGPGNVGGRTRALGLDIANENIILAAGVSGGMWRSTNGGTSWTRVTLENQVPNVTCLAQDTRTGKTNTWYYGTGEFRTNVQRWGNALYYGSGIFKSTDDGITWNQMSSTASSVISGLSNDFEYVNNIVTDPSNQTQDVVYAAVYGAIERSSDGGNSWTAVLGSNTNTAGYTNVAIAPNGVVYAALGSGGSTHGIWRSPDGVHWTDITPTNFWADSTRGITLNIAAANPNILYVLAETPNIGGTTGRGLAIQGSYGFEEWYSLWKYDYFSGNGSGNNGNWIDKSAYLPTYNGKYLSFNGLASYAMVVKVSPADTNRVFLGGTCLYYSSDDFTTSAGITWLGGYSLFNGYASGSSTRLHPDQHTFVFSYKNPNNFYTGSDGGVFKIANSQILDSVWTGLNNGYTTGQFYSVAIDRQTEGSFFTVGGLQDNGSWVSDTLDPQVPWSGDYSGGDGALCVVGDSGNTVVVSSQYANMTGYFNSGNNANISPSGNYASDLFVTPFVLDPNNSNYFFLSGSGDIWRNTSLTSSGSHGNWSEISTTVTDDASSITAITVSTANPQHRVYYGTSSGRVFAMDNATSTVPAPYEITGNNFPAGAWVNCIAVDPFDAKRIMVVFSNYNVQSLFYTSDEGTTWTAVGGNLEENPNGTGSGPSCRWASILHRNGDTIYFVGTSVGLFSTTSLSGESPIWTQEGASTIGNDMVNMIDVRQSDRYVAVATWGNGMFSTMYPDHTVGVNEALAEAPQNIVLQQNYPNPFGGTQNSTTVQFTIPDTYSVRSTAILSLYDENGRLVRTLLNSDLSPGKHEATISSEGLPSGTYYYRLQVGDKQATHAMRVAR